MAPRPLPLSRLSWCAMLVVASAAPRLSAQETRLTRTDGSIIVSEKWDAKTCLIAARTALARGDLDAAEALAVQAENTPRGLIAIIGSRWSDTPAKVFRAIAAARARERVILIKEIDERDTAASALPKIIQHPPKAVVMGMPKPPNAAPAFPAIVTVSDFTLAPVPRNASGIAKYQRDFFGTSATAPAAEPKDSRGYLLAGIKAFQNGDAAAARACTAQAKEHRDDAVWSRDEVKRLRAYLHAHTTGD